MKRGGGEGQHFQSNRQTKLRRRKVRAYFPGHSEGSLKAWPIAKLLLDWPCKGGGAGGADGEGGGRGSIYYILNETLSYQRCAFREVTCRVAPASLAILFPSAHAVQGTSR